MSPLLFALRKLVVDEGQSRCLGKNGQEKGFSASLGTGNTSEVACFWQLCWGHFCKLNQVRPRKEKLQRD